MFARSIQVDHDVYVSLSNQVPWTKHLDQRAHEIVEQWFWHVVKVSYPPEKL